MAFETKEDVLDKLMSMEKPKCPYCEKSMDLWEPPPVNFSDGLGWGVPYLYMCTNDECPMFVEGWENMRENFAQNASYRCICYPGEKNFECMPVFSPHGGMGQVITDQTILQQEVLKENIKKGFSILTDCYLAKDGVSVLRILTDATEPIRVRIKAAEIIGDIGELEAIDPLRNLKFENQKLKDQIVLSIQKIHERFFTKECPYCAEIVKKKAVICKHCGKEI